MKPLYFQVLLALAEGKRHGWALVRELQQRGEKVLPGNFYRTLRSMLADGLIEEADGPQADQARRYFRLTAAGREAARHEARRLESLVAESRSKKLLSAKGR